MTILLVRSNLAHMNWHLAIARNRRALLTVVAAIVAMVGGREGGVVARRLHHAALALLRPVESATRRLIVIAARGLIVAPRPTPAFPAGLGQRAGKSAARPPAFRLVDPVKRHAFRPVAPPPRGVPRIRSLWATQPLPLLAPPVHAVPLPAARATLAQTDRDAPTDTARLHQRLAAVERALADLPRQARRLLRWRERQAREAGKRDRPPRRPLRLGRPPGWRKSGDRTVDPVLAECHRLALDALAERPSRRDTS